VKRFLFIVMMFFVTKVFADTHVNGYYRKDGTYVKPHYRSDADSNPFNNYSTKGNVNPYTGQRGTVNPYGQTRNPYQPKSTNTYGY